MMHWAQRAIGWGVYVFAAWGTYQIATWIASLFTFPLVDSRVFNLLRWYVAVGLLIPVTAFVLRDVRSGGARKHISARLGGLGVIALLLIFLQLTTLLSLNALWWRDLIVRKDFGAVNWTGMNLSNLDLSGANLTNATLTAANLTNADLSGAVLLGADLTAANLSSATLIGAELRGTTLNGANLSNANLATASLPFANLNSANLSGTNLFRANFTEAGLRSADLSGANLLQAWLSNADLRGATLLGAIPSDALLWQDAILDGRTTLPDGTRYVAP